MKAAIHINNLEHQRTHGAAMKVGLERHGIDVEYAAYDNPVACDFAVVWGAPSKHPRVRDAVPNLLVMEAGHLSGHAKTRLDYTSCGWNGLARRGKYPQVDDGGERWRKYWGHLMRPWHRIRGSYALIFGQVEGDAALQGLDMRKWSQKIADDLVAKGYRVRYRPHPVTLLRDGDDWTPEGARLSRSTLEDDIHGAIVAVSYNSTAGVESVLGGVPTVTMDEGAMAWPVTTHSLAEDRITPDRADWAYRLAWCQWTLQEIAAGVAWEYLQMAMNPSN